MAVNLASKYSPVVAERFRTTSLTNIAFNEDYDFLGVDTVNIYSIDNMPMNNYTRNGLQRYGTPAEIEDTVQTLTLTQDRSFTGIIDQGNAMESMYVRRAGEAVVRQIDERANPEIDTYRLTRFVAATPTGGINSTPPTTTNAYSLFLEGQQYLGNNLVPQLGRVAFVSYSFLSMLKLDSAFVGMGNSSQISLVNGELGRVDGVPIIPLPEAYFPANVNMILVHPSIAIAPITIADLHIHVNPPGISGVLLEGRFRYDAFILAARNTGIYVLQS